MAAANTKVGQQADAALLLFTVGAAIVVALLYFLLKIFVKV
jgi:hypothetical protein